MSNNPFKKFFKEQEDDEKSIRRKKYNAFKTAVETYNDWMILEEYGKREYGEKYNEFAEAILAKVGCYSLIITLLEDRIRVFFWWAAFLDKLQIVGKDKQRVVTENEFKIYHLRPVMDKSFDDGVTPVVIMINRLRKKSSYFNEINTKRLIQIFQFRNEIMHTSFMQHNLIEPRNVDEIFKIFRMIDVLLKRIQRKYSKLKKSNLDTLK